MGLDIVVPLIVSCFENTILVFSVNFSFLFFFIFFIFYVFSGFQKKKKLSEANLFSLFSFSKNEKLLHHSSLISNFPINFIIINIIIYYYFLFKFFS